MATSSSKLGSLRIPTTGDGSGIARRKGSADKDDCFDLLSVHRVGNFWKVSAEKVWDDCCIEGANEETSSDRSRTEISSNRTVLIFVVTRKDIFFASPCGGASSFVTRFSL